MNTLLTLFAFFFGASLASYWGQWFSRKQSASDSLRSLCDYCHKALNALMIIPVLGYLISKGKSLCCKKPIHKRYPISEVLNGVLLGGSIIFLYETEILADLPRVAQWSYTLLLLLSLEIIFLIAMKELWRE